MSAPRVLAVGGIDPCGGAGLSMDARMVAAHGGLALTVPTCLTVQNRHGFSRHEPVAGSTFAAMLGAALEDGPVHAAKLGLLGDPEVARALVGALPQDVPLVVDPVLSATAGGFEAAEALVETYRDVLAPRGAIFTPNGPELERLGGVTALLQRGAGAVLVTGGHGTGASVEDVLWTAAGTVVIAHPRLAVGPVHGTGCALAAALACGLGRGAALEDACRAAVQRVGRALAETPPSVDGRPVPLAVV